MELINKTDANLNIALIAKNKAKSDAQKALMGRVLFMIDNMPTIEAIPKANVYKAIQEMMKYEHEGFINISLARLEEILKKCGVSEDENDNR